MGKLEFNFNFDFGVDFGVEFGVDFGFGVDFDLGFGLGVTMVDRAAAEVMAASESIISIGDVDEFATDDAVVDVVDVVEVAEVADEVVATVRDLASDLKNAPILAVGSRLRTSKRGLVPPSGSGTVAASIATVALV